MAYGLEPNSISFAKPQYASVARVGLSDTFVFIASVILSSKILINKSIVRIPFKAVIKSEVMCRALHFTLNRLVPVYIVSQHAVICILAPCCYVCVLPVHVLC